MELNGKKEMEGALVGSKPHSRKLIRLFAALFSSTLSSQRLLHAALLARLQIKGVTLHVLNDVLGLHLALESTQSIF